MTSYTFAINGSPASGCRFKSAVAALIFAYSLQLPLGAVITVVQLGACAPTATFVVSALRAALADYPEMRGAPDAVREKLKAALLLCTVSGLDLADEHVDALVDEAMRLVLQ